MHTPEMPRQQEVPCWKRAPRGDEGRIPRRGGALRRSRVEGKEQTSCGSGSAAASTSARGKQRLICTPRAQRKDGKRAAPSTCGVRGWRDERTASKDGVRQRGGATGRNTRTASDLLATPSPSSPLLLSHLPCWTSNGTRGAAVGATRANSSARRRRWASTCAASGVPASSCRCAAGQPVGSGASRGSAARYSRWPQLSCCAIEARASQKAKGSLPPCASAARATSSRWSTATGSMIAALGSRPIAAPGSNGRVAKMPRPPPGDSRISRPSRSAPRERNQRMRPMCGGSASRGRFMWAADGRERGLASTAGPQKH